jgi:1-deoxy-D-xylulose-5-phosphate reductoisomerase
MDHPVKRLAILGSTGSIGQQTLDIVRSYPDRFSVIALAAGSNLELLSQQIKEFKPAVVYLQREGCPSLVEGCEQLNPEEIACLPEADIVVIAVSGDAGLRPTLAAVSAGKRIALANKESLVAAGEIITSEAKRMGACIMPVDSEHSAIWQCLSGEECTPDRLILTASGGPFRHIPVAELRRVTPEQALKHPSWKMGKKVTIDSATLMNKGLEVIEAHWLFGMPIDRISIVVHPESIIHSMVEFADGTIKAQLSCPDMRLPIQYALSYPERLKNPDLPRLDFKLVSRLSFEEPNLVVFPCLRLAIEAGQKGETYPAVLSAADETAVGLFLSGRIGFHDIAQLVERTLTEHTPVMKPSLDDILAAADWARKTVKNAASGASM